jgi:ABC-type transport system substrate-binding protein
LCACTKRFSDYEEKEEGKGLMNAKKFYATFVSLLLAMVMIMCTMVIVHADVYPGVPPYPAHPGKLLPVAGPYDEPGFYGGYHSMWNLIMPSLSDTIGFSSANPMGNYWAMADDWSFYDIIWDEPGWQHSTQNTNPAVLAPHGWDLTAFEWWTMPTGMLWTDGIILEENIPPTGRNVWPYVNPVADDLYWKYQASADPAERKSWIDAWQFELMRDPVMANVYFPYIYEVYGSYITGWYGTVGWYDIDNLGINAAKVNEIYNAGNMSLAERDRLLAGTLKYGVKEDWWSFNPAFVDTYTEETMANLITGTLYALSLDPWSAPGTVPLPEEYYSKPDLAAGPPVITDGGYTATIPLKDEVYWSDGHKFDAGDVVYTYNLNLYIPSRAVGRYDLRPIVSSVEVGAHPLEVVLHLERPYEDLENILSNSWGLGIIPEHFYSSIPMQSLKGDMTNYDAATHMAVPYLGPFQLVEATTSYLRYEKHPGWWGNAYGYTVQDTVNEIILEKVEDPWTRLGMLVEHELDFAEHTIVYPGDFVPLTTHEDLTVFERPYCASNGVWFNFNNPYLSNRYVRLAICYAIPYADIWNNVLPSWGVSDWIAGGNLVHPWQYYGGIQLMNTVMPPYTYNPAWANAYLDMWKLSRIAHAPGVASGPVGDADFNGIVELDDLLLVYLNLGLTEAQMDAASLPGHDVDADFNNDNIVDDVDKTLWDANVGVYYPDGTKTKTYPY